MNRLLLASLFSVTLMHTAHADEKSHKKLAEELLALMDVQKTSEQTFEFLKKMQMSQVKNMNIPPEASERIKSFQNQLMDLMAKEMSWDKVKQDYVTVYVDTFTEQELQGIIGFYKSPAGKAFLKKSPEMMKRSMEVSQKQMERIAPKIQELTKKMMEELKDSQKGKPEEK